MTSMLKTALSLQKRTLTIGVVGAGQMGIGIAYVAALALHPVKLYDSYPAQQEKGLKFIDVLLKKDVLKGKMSEEEAAALRARITPCAIEGFGECDFAIEVCLVV